MLVLRVQPRCNAPDPFIQRKRVMVIPEEHKETIRALVEADPEVAQATCDIPHLDPRTYLRTSYPWEGTLPYCGCFVGVYAWMQECKRGNEPPGFFNTPIAISYATNIPEDDIGEFAHWCITDARDHEAVRYARGLLEERRG